MIENDCSGVYNGFKITFLGFGIVPIGFLIFVIWEILTSPLTINQLILLISLLIFTFFLWFLYSWKDYLEDYYTPKKLRWDEEGIEMINLFDKRVKIPWKYILTVKYYRQKIMGKWRVAYYVRYRIPDLFLFKQNRFWVSTDIGNELYAYWAKIKAKQEWGADEKDLEKLEMAKSSVEK